MAPFPDATYSDHGGFGTTCPGGQHPNFPGYSNSPDQSHGGGNNESSSIDEPHEGDQMFHAADVRKRFACPFFKLDPIEHQSCEHYNLTNWYHTHQHIGRVHVLSNQINRSAYCPTCRIQFKGKDANVLRDFHIRQNKCKEATKEETGMLLPEEFAMLARLGTGLSSEGRWNAAWGKLFSSLVRPSSPYFESRVDLFRRHAPERLRRALGALGLDDLTINGLADQLFSVPTIPQKVSQSYTIGPGVDTSLNQAASSAQFNNNTWLLTESQVSPSPVHAPAELYAPGFAQNAMMPAPLDLSMQPMGLDLHPEATNGMGVDLFPDQAGAFFGTSASQPDEDLAMYTDHGYMSHSFPPGSIRW